MVDLLVRDHHQRSSRQSLLQQLAQENENPRLDVNRIYPEGMTDGDGYQVTSPLPARWLACRARVKRRSESRFR